MIRKHNGCDTSPIMWSKIISLLILKPEGKQTKKKQHPNSYYATVIRIVIASFDVHMKYIEMCQMNKHKSVSTSINFAMIFQMFKST